MGSKYGDIPVIYIVKLHIETNGEMKIFFTSLKHFYFHLLSSENSVQICKILGLKQFLKCL